MSSPNLKLIHGTVTGVPGALKSNGSHTKWRKPSVFLSCRTAASRLQVSHLLFFVRFPRKKEKGSVPVPGAGAARGYNLIIGEKNGVFSAYF
jgi:hypothetical protein